MVNTCCVPGCKTGYRSTHSNKIKLALYKFPKNPELRQNWIRAISRYNWTPSKFSRVCAKHFHDEDVHMTSTDNRRTKRGTHQSHILQRSRLIPGAIPKVFLNMPSYLSPSLPVSSSENITSSALERQHARTESLNKEFVEKQVCLCV